MRILLCYLILILLLHKCHCQTPQLTAAILLLQYAMFNFLKVIVENISSIYILKKQVNTSVMSASYNTMKTIVQLINICTTLNIDMKQTLKCCNLGAFAAATFITALRFFG